jgi:flagellar basal-body rod modification protein FlgD
MTAPIGQTYRPQGTGSTAQTAVSTEAMGSSDMFMKLLVAQLKYQNPMSPTDSNQQMSQMAVFAQVEKLGQLVEAQKTAQAWQERLSAESLVGRTVTGTDADLAQHTGVVTSVVLGKDGPRLTLDDGSTLAIGEVTKVEQTPEPEPGPEPSPTSSS